MPLPPPEPGQVRMTHSGLPGVEVYMGQTAYRETFWPEGWRSNDDPTFVPGLTADIHRYVHVPSNWGDHWRQAKKDAATRVVKVHAWGDSITVGDDGGGTGTPAGFRDSGWMGRLGTKLQAVYGDAGSGFYPVGLATTTGTWTAGFGVGSCASTATAAASMTWEGVKGTTVVIYHKNTSITGTLRYQIDGGGFTSVTPPTGFGVEPGAVVVTGLSDTTHTVRVEWVSGTVTIHGVEGRRGTTGVRMGRFAQHGQAGSHYSGLALDLRQASIGTTNASATITSATPGTFTSADVGRAISGANIPLGATITAVASATSATLSANASGTGTVTATISQPLYTNRSGIGTATIKPFLAEGQGQADLVIVALGVNDPASLVHSPDTYCDGISHIIRPYFDFAAGGDPSYTPDFLVIINHHGKWFDVEQEWPQYVAAQRYMADALGAAVLDLWEFGQRSWLYMQTIQYWAGASFDNTVHPGPFGHQMIADALIRLLV